MKRPFLIAGFAGALALAAGALVNTPIKGIPFICPEGFTRPILAFELMQSPAEFNTFFAVETPDLSHRIDKMKEALQRDNYFVPLYTLFMVLFVLTIRRLTGQKWYWLLAALAIIIGLLDIFENNQQAWLVSTLSSATPAINQGDFQRLLWYAWPKWILLGVFFLGLAPFLWRSNFIGRILACASLVTLPLCLAGCLLHWNQGAEWYVLATLFGLFPLILVFCFVYQKPKMGSATI